MPERSQTSGHIDSDSKRRHYSLLVVDDEYIVAMDICEEMASEPVSIVGPAGTLKLALKLAAETSPLHFAFLDVNLGGQLVFPVADILAERGIPFVFASGYDRSVLPERFQRRPLMQKPFIISDLKQLFFSLVEG
jgi:hypothetical protein